MNDETQVEQIASANDASDLPSPAVQPADSRFPAEPFACPNCGQMLGPGVRVCAACRRPIDPSQIKLVPAASASQAAPFVPRAQAQVRFPWGVFVVFLVLGSVMTSEGMTALGFLKALLVFLAIQVLSSVWVFYDANQKGIPKPLYWGIGSLFFWLPIFSWYLVRRRQPQAACPLIEAGPWRFLNTLLLIFAVSIFLTLLVRLLLGPGPSQKSQPSSPAADHGGSIALVRPSPTRRPSIASAVLLEGPCGESAAGLKWRGNDRDGSGSCPAVDRERQSAGARRYED